jgi:restriction system protein
MPPFSEPNMSHTQHQYLLVRAMGQTPAEFEVFFDNGVVAVGWSNANFSKVVDPTTLVARVKDAYYEGSSTAPQVVARKLNEVRRFKNIRPGDRIIVPYYSTLRLAIAEEDELFDSGRGYNLDLANQRRVRYVRTDDGQYVTIPRRSLSEALQRRARARGTTVADLFEFASELEPLFQGDHSGWFAQIEKAEALRVDRFKRELLRNIRKGNTNLQAGGYGLEELVRDLLTSEGYSAQILSKRAFQGVADADVLATRSDRFGETKLLVQVKHHQGVTGTFGAEQLAEIRNATPELYQDYSLVLVSSAQASPELAAACEAEGILLVDGNELVDWIYDLLPRLDAAIRIRLGISEVPEFAVV